MVAYLMKSRKVSAVIVGADRVASNGDTANKIGTYNIAIAAKYHNVPFYVACPRSSFDFSLASGDEIPIEERPSSELTTINSVPIAAKGMFFVLFACISMHNISFKKAIYFSLKIFIKHVIL